MMEPKDHDLLIQMDVKLDRVIKDVADLNDSTARRVSDLEQEKLDKAEAARLQKESEAVHANHNRRITFLERGYWIAAGALSVIDIVISILVAYLIKHLP